MTTHSCLQWVMQSNLPLVFFEDRLSKKHTDLEMDHRTLKDAAFAVVGGVEKTIAESLSDAFRIVFDG